MASRFLIRLSALATCFCAASLSPAQAQQGAFVELFCDMRDGKDMYIRFNEQREIVQTRYTGEWGRNWCESLIVFNSVSPKRCIFTDETVLAQSDHYRTGIWVGELSVDRLSGEMMFRPRLGVKGVCRLNDRERKF